MMSIVKYISRNEYPEEGSIVCAEGNHPKHPILWSDRCIYRDGVFTSGGEQPVPEYVLPKVTRWFYLDEYSRKHKNPSCHTVSFDQADRMPEDV